MKRKPFLITDNTSGVYSFAYDNLNRMTTRVMPNGVSTTTDYDGMGRIKFFKNTNASSNVLNEFVYSYNTANQITQITEPTVRTRTFGYDNADRLTSSTSTLPNQNESYTFDDVGNRTSSHLSSVYGYQQGSFNRLASTQQASYSFDNNGNLTSKTEGTAKWYYSYDRENRLMNATKFGGMMPRANESINYQYDAFGRRVVRQDKKTGRTEFTHDGMDVIQDRFEKNDGTLSTTNYINGIGIDDKLKATSGTTSKYFLQDHLGSTVGMSDTNGNVTESATYDSFGNKTGTLSTRYQYTGREQDETTGLMYYRARFYDPQIGRFTSEDPIGFAGGDVNLYGYVWNNPQHFTDPSGTIALPSIGVLKWLFGNPNSDDCDNCKKDVQRILDTFEDSKNTMTANGQRHPFFAYNGIKGTIDEFRGRRSDYLACYNQAEELIKHLKAKQYAENWDFRLTQINVPAPYFGDIQPHTYVVATSGNPKCQSLTLDPWVGIIWKFALA